MVLDTIDDLYKKLKDYRIQLLSRYKLIRIINDLKTCEVIPSIVGLIQEEYINNSIALEKNIIYIKILIREMKRK